MITVSMYDGFKYILIDIYVVDYKLFLIHVVNSRLTLGLLSQVNGRNYIFFSYIIFLQKISEIFINHLFLKG